MNIREKLFWLFDKLNGSKLSKHFDDISSHFYNYNNKDVTEKRLLRLENMLKYAISNIPYYNTIPDSTIQNFPVVNKLIIKKNIDYFFSKEKFDGAIREVTTSGSTGTPFTVYWDTTKINRHKADNVFFHKLASSNVGHRLLYFRVWNKINQKNWIIRKIENLKMIEISNFSDSRINQILTDIHKEKKSVTILSFASALDNMAKYIGENSKIGKFSNVNSIIAMSEYLPEESRKILQSTFNCNLVSRYSNMENGFIAQQIADSKEYYINHGSYLVEILDLVSDVRVKDGQIGRIVITDLFNKKMPLIRYDTGDLGVLGIIDGKEHQGPVLIEVLGRKVDSIYNCIGELMSPHTITNTMWNYTYINQFQFIQRGIRSYHLKINSDNPFSEKEELSKELRRYLGKHAEITFEDVIEIPPLSSGKRRKIVNDMLKN